MAGLEDILGMLGGSGGNDPLSALSLLSTLSQMGGGNTGDLSGLMGILGAMGGGSGQSEPAEDPAIDIAEAEADPCARCPIRCDRANLQLPAYDEVRRMAEDWERY